MDRGRTRRPVRKRIDHRAPLATSVRWRDAARSSRSSPAAAADLLAIARIYGTAVRTSVATFDLTDPPNSYWKHKISSSVSGDHVLVVEDGPDVVGYAYSGAFRSRPAYAQTRETSVYLAPEAVGAGLGTLLYSQLLSLLRTDGIHLVVAVIAQPNSASVALHEKLGFELVGTLREVGRKFDRWIDTRWYQLALERQPPASSRLRGDL